MRLFRRSIQTFVAAWGAGMLVTIVGWIVPMSAALQAGLSLGAILIGGVAGWRASRDVAPWNSRDLRDGAIGWGIVGGAIAVLLAFAFAPSGWQLPGVLIAAGVSAGLAALVHRHADSLGTPSPTHTAL